MTNCPLCGATLKEHTTDKGALFLVCSRWPRCKASGTPELLQALEKQHFTDHEPMKIGTISAPLAELRILQSKLRTAKTEEERRAIREQARDVLQDIR